MNSPVFTLFAGIASAHFLALLSPGPDFTLLVKSGITHPRKKALGVVVGITASNALYIALCLSGLALILAASPQLIQAIKLAGGVYLCRIGIPSLFPGKKTVRTEGSGQKADGNTQTTFLKELALGFTASLLNPKLPLFYLGLFSLLFGKNINIALILGMGVWMTLAVFAWDSLLLYFLSTKTIQKFLQKYTGMIAKACGILLCMLGFSLLVSFFLGILKLA